MKKLCFFSVLFVTLIGGQQYSFGMNSSGGSSECYEYLYNNQKTINIKDAGARGDGRSDDLAVIQRALDMVERSGGGEIIIPQSEGDYMVSNTLYVGSNTTITFTGSSYLKLSRYTTVGTMFFNKPGSTGIVFNKPLLDGNHIFAGGSGQNGISFGNGGTCVVKGGHIRNFERGDIGPKDGGKGLQIESSSVVSFSANGTVIENCHKAISVHRDLSKPGKITASFNNIYAKRCDQFAIVTQTNGIDTSGLQLKVTVSNFTAENCGNVDGVFIMSRANNVKFLNGKVTGQNKVNSVIRGRYTSCSFSNIKIQQACVSVIDLNPSWYGPDTFLAQKNNYDLNITGAYDYLLKSDKINSNPNRSLVQSNIKALVKSNASKGLVFGEARSNNTTLSISTSRGKKFEGSTFKMTTIGNKVDL